jgi:hypothetical protein
MIEFNSTGIVAGYIKQLLASFNLPKARIYTREHAKYLQEHGEEDPTIIGTTPYTKVFSGSNNQPSGGDSPKPAIYYAHYIKDGKLQEYFIDEKEWKPVGKRNTPDRIHVHYYNRGQRILNGTRTLEIRDNIYDSYTHEYLGEYLRFIRDFDGIDLMAMYNCFSNRLCANLDLKFTSATNSEVTFIGSDTRYKLYCVPVKLFKTYTIAIDSDLPIELCCGIYNIRQDTRPKFEQLPSITYKKITSSKFSSPFLFDLLQHDLLQNNLEQQQDGKSQTEKTVFADFKLDLAQCEENLKLFIKLPISNKSSIVVLEGDYVGWSDFSTTTRTKIVERAIVETDTDGKRTSRTDYIEVGYKVPRRTNRQVVSAEAIKNDADFRLISMPQLLRLNTCTQVPFSSRLLEYLLGNCITDSDEVVSKDVVRTQNVVALGFNSEQKRRIYTPQFSGIWDPELRKILYSYMTSKYDTFDINYDILGYVDKDVEKLYTVPLDQKHQKKTGKTNVSIMHADILEED